MSGRAKGGKGKKKEKESTTEAMEVPLEGAPTELPAEDLMKEALEAPIPAASEKEAEKEETKTEKKKREPKGKGRAKGKGKADADADADADEEEKATPAAPAATTTTTTTDAPPTLAKTKSQVQKSGELINSLLKDAKSREIEVVFAFDTTGSMMSYLNEVKKNLRETITKLLKDIPGIRIGIMAIGDYCDDHSTYAVKTLDLGNNVDEIVKWVDNVQSTGGGDFPEAYEAGLREARSLSWTPGEGNKAFVVIGDAPPHPASYTDQKIFWKEEVEELIKLGVKLYGVQAGTNDESKVFYQEISELSGGVYLDLKKMPLITDMFMAVCYKEFGAEHLENFKTTVAAEGRLESDLSSMLETLASSGSEKKSAPAKNVTYAWYSKENDHGSPSYFWNATTSHWVGSKPAAAAAPAAGGPVFFDSKISRDKKKASPKKKAKKAEVAKEEPKKKAKKDDEKEEKKEKAKEEKKKKESPKKKEVKKEKEEKKRPKRKVASDDKEKKKAKKEWADAVPADDVPKLKKAKSHVVGSGDWKRDRSGRLASLKKE